MTKSQIKQNVIESISNLAIERFDGDKTQAYLYLTYRFGLIAEMSDLQQILSDQLKSVKARVTASDGDNN